jgi:hypothetical protein
MQRYFFISHSFLKIKKIFIGKVEFFHEIHHRKLACTNYTIFNSITYHDKQNDVVFIFKMFF